MDELEEQLEQRAEEVEAAKAQFQERTAFLEQRVFSAEAVRRSLHNKVPVVLLMNVPIFSDLLRSVVDNAGYGIERKHPRILPR